MSNWKVFQDNVTPCHECGTPIRWVRGDGSELEHWECPDPKCFTRLTPEQKLAELFGTKEKENGN